MRPLTIDAGVDIETASGLIRVEGSGRDLCIHLQTLQEDVGVLSAHFIGRHSARRLVALSDTLEKLDLNLTLMVDKAPLIRIGPDASPQRVLRWLGLPFELNFRRPLMLIAAYSRWRQY